MNKPLSGLVIAPNGDTESVVLPDEDHQRLTYLQDKVGGYIEVVPLPNERYMVLHEDEKLRPHQINESATLMAHAAESIRRDDYIAGTVIVIPKSALN